MKADLKVSFYLKKKIARNRLCPVMGRITIGKEMVQFSCKLEASPKLWDTHAGRVTGKSAHARDVNREIDKMNVAIHARYGELVVLKGTATPLEVKEAFQGILPSEPANVGTVARYGINVRLLRTSHRFA